MKRTMVEVSPPRWQWRLIVSIVLLLIGRGASKAYHIIQGPLEAQAVVDSVNGNDEEIYRALAFATTDVSFLIMGTILFCLGAFVWLPYLLALLRYHKASEAPSASVSKETQTPASDETTS